MLALILTLVFLAGVAGVLMKCWPASKALPGHRNPPPPPRRPSARPLSGAVRGPVGSSTAVSPSYTYTYDDDTGLTLPSFENLFPSSPDPAPTDAGSFDFGGGDSGGGGATGEW